MAKRPDNRHPGKHSKKDPAKPTRAKASRAELLNPAIGQGRAGLGAQTGSPSPQEAGEAQASKLAPPPDNSWDRRSDFSNAHKARKSTQQGFNERPQSGYAAKGPTDIDPELAEALGYGGSDPSRPLVGQPPEAASEEPELAKDRDELAEIF